VKVHPVGQLCALGVDHAQPFTGFPAGQPPVAQSALVGVPVHVAAEAAAFWKTQRLPRASTAATHVACVVLSSQSASATPLKVWHVPGEPALKTQPVGVLLAAASTVTVWALQLSAVTVWAASQVPPAAVHAAVSAIVLAVTLPVSPILQYAAWLHRLMSFDVPSHVGVATLEPFLSSVHVASVQVPAAAFVRAAPASKQPVLVA